MDRTPRKRRRAGTDGEDSPAVDSTSAGKRRRVESGRKASSGKNTGLTALASAIGGVFGFGQAASPKLDAAYDVPESDDENATHSRKVTSSLPSVKPPRPRGKRRSSGGPASNVYDVPDSGDEVEIENNANPATKDLSGPAVKSRGAAVRAKSNRSSRQNGNSATSLRSTKDLESTGEDESTQQGTPSKSSGRKNSALSNPKAIASGSAARSATKRQVNGSRKADAASDVPKLKGILTPQKRKVGRPRKSVAFDNNNGSGGAEVFFEDLPNKASTGKKTANTASPKTKTRVADDQDGAKAGENGDSDESVDEDDEDDEVCVICEKPDSKASNQILFCDGCDMGFHQKCYQVSEIPKGDWYCRKCVQEGTVEDIGNEAEAQDTVSAKTPDIPNFAQHLQTLQRVLLDRCSGIRRTKLLGQDEAYEKAFQLVEQTVLAGEGNSMMVIGARGCGKTAMVETILSNLAAEHGTEFHVVRLNGFIHTDDKLALKEIWRQLGREMEVDDELTNKTNNIADTLASLLALLSHPSEIAQSDEGVTSKSVVFVIDEFDLFATHARQTLLYNLFDIAQARKAPIAVLGLTTRIDVVESLEKRVKSRFSHRYVYLSLPKSLPAFWDICRQGLLVQDDDLEAEGFNVKLDGIQEFQAYWKDKIESLHKTKRFQDHLEYHFYTTKSMSAFLNTCILPLASLSATSTALRIPSPLQMSVSLEPPDSKLHILPSLSDVELALLIAAARLDIVAHTDTVNFAMAYDEYASQMGKQRVQTASSGMLALGAGAKVWGRAVAGMAWERLISLGLLLPAGIGGRSHAAHGGLEAKMWKLEVALDEIPAAVELPSFLIKWCTHI